MTCSPAIRNRRRASARARSPAKSRSGGWTWSGLGTSPREHRTSPHFEGTAFAQAHPTSTSRSVRARDCRERGGSVACTANGRRQMTTAANQLPCWPPSRRQLWERQLDVGPATGTHGGDRRSSIGAFSRVSRQRVEITEGDDGSAPRSFRCAGCPGRAEVVQPRRHQRRSRCRRRKRMRKRAVDPGHAGRVSGIRRP